MKFAIPRRLNVVIPACLQLSTVDPKPKIRKPLCPFTQDMARLLLFKYFPPYAVQNARASVFVADLRRLLNKRASKTTLLWIPGQHGIAGNEQADACTKQAAAINDCASQPVSFAADSEASETLTDPPP